MGDQAHCCQLRYLTPADMSICCHMDIDNDKHIIMTFYNNTRLLQSKIFVKLRQPFLLNLTKENLSKWRNNRSGIVITKRLHSFTTHLPRIIFVHLWWIYVWPFSPYSFYSIKLSPFVDYGRLPSFTSYYGRLFLFILDFQPFFNV
jgi:hypothetical protein